MAPQGHPFLVYLVDDNFLWLNNRRFPSKALVHPCHESQQEKHIDRKECHADVVSQYPKQGRHQAAAHIGAGHLYPNNSLRTVCAKVGGSGMDDARVNRGTAQAHQP